MKVHLHEEQFDNWLHATCHRLDAKPGSPNIVSEEVFDLTLKEERCKLCSEYWYPNGDPEDRFDWWRQRALDYKNSNVRKD